MAKQSNDFQKLLYRIQKWLRPRGATVTESAQIFVPKLGIFREVDVLVEASGKMHTTKVAFEAKDLKRIFTVDQMDGLVGKYCAKAAAEVDRVCVVTRNGFSNAAAKMAVANGIEIYTLDEVKEREGEMLLLGSQLSIDNGRNIIRVQLSAADCSQITDDDVFKSSACCQAHGCPHENVLDILEKYVNGMEENELQMALQHGEGRFLLIDISRLFLRAKNRNIPLASARIEIEPSLRSPFENKSYVLRGGPIGEQTYTEALAKASGDHDIRFVVDPSIKLNSPIEVSLKMRHKKELSHRIKRKAPLG